VQGKGWLESQTHGQADVRRTDSWTDRQKADRLIDRETSNKQTDGQADEPDVRSDGLALCYKFICERWTYKETDRV
jgi:hypothetical protein